MPFLFFLFTFPLQPIYASPLLMNSLLTLKRSWSTMIVVFFTLSFVSCEDFSFRNGINQGKIEYDITYPNIPEDSYLLDLMPKKMETTFKNNNFRNDIVAGMGMFKTSVICGAGQNTITHSIKILAKKYASTLTPDQVSALNPDFQNIEITLTEEEKEIAGYHCKSARVDVLGDSTWSFTLFYTDEIRIKDANIHTPFKEIDGVLLEYDIYSYNTHMHFSANKVIQSEVQKEDVTLENGYEIVEVEKIKSEIEGMFEKIQ